MKSYCFAELIKLDTSDSEGLPDIDYSGRSFIIPNTPTQSPKEIWDNPDLKLGVITHCNNHWGQNWYGVLIIDITNPYPYTLFNN
jgi:hypothetical protein